MSPLFRFLIFASLIGLSGYLVIIIRGFLAYSQPELKNKARSGNSNAQKVLAAKELGNRLWLILGFSLSLVVFAIITGLNYINFGLYWLAAGLISCFYFYLIFEQNSKPNLKRPAGVSLLILKINRWLPNIQPGLDNKILEPDETGSPRKIDKIRDVLIRKLQVGSDKDLQLIARIMHFCRQRVKDWMIPKKYIKTVKQSVKLTVASLDSLHKLNQGQILVTDDDKQQFVGILDLADLDEIVRKTGSAITVGQVMRPNIYFIDSEADLVEAIQTFLENKCQLILVKNENDQIIGGLNRQSIFQQIARLKFK